MKTPEVKMMSVDKLIPYANNSRTHSDAQVAQVAASIKEFGFTNPILIDGENGIIAGHGRVLAARKLGMDEVPCIELAHLTKAQKSAYIIADNKLALNAGWDEELLKLELEGLVGIEQISTGFGPDELNLLFNGWQSDINLSEKDGANLDGILFMIKIGVSQEEKEFAREAITNALDQAGIEYEFK